MAKSRKLRDKKSKMDNASEPPHDPGWERVGFSRLRSELHARSLVFCAMSLADLHSMNFVNTPVGGKTKKMGSSRRCVAGRIAVADLGGTARTHFDKRGRGNFSPFQQLDGGECCCLPGLICSRPHYVTADLHNTH